MEPSHVSLGAILETSADIDGLRAYFAAEVLL
jgi:hypothetical protein